jgi:hypothetical protein
MLSSPSVPEESDSADRSGRIVGIARRAAMGTVAYLRALTWRDWLGWLAGLALLGLWLGPRPYVEPRMDLTVRSLSFDSADHWDWAVTGCTAGPRVRMVAIVKNLGTVPVEKHEATVRFVGRPIGGTDAEVIAFDAPLDSVSTSRRTDHRSADATITLTEALLAGPSVWSATVVHPDDEAPKNDTLSGVTLTPCR